MEKIYYNDQYIKDFVAELVKVEQKDNTFHLVLDKTAFFPGDGKQFCDLGFIENEKVIDVYEKDGVIYHVMEKKPIKIHKLKCSIDWDRRKDGMEHNLGQLILSSCLYEMFKFNTVDFNIGKDICTIDIDGILDEDKIREVERAANLIIEDDIKVEILTPDRKELKKLGIKKTTTNTSEEIRVVKIGDLYVDLSNGVYPNSTIELRMIKITRWEKHKNSTIIEYKVGQRAIEDSFNKDMFTSNICKYLNASEDEAIDGIKDLNQKLKESLNKNRQISEELANYQVKEMIELGEKIGEITLVKKVYENENVKYASKIASKIVDTSKAIVLMAVKSEDRINLIFAASKGIKTISMNDLLKDAITLIDGNGGGSSHLAQGAGKNNNNLQSTLDYAINKIKQRI